MWEKQKVLVDPFQKKGPKSDFVPREMKSVTATAAIITAAVAIIILVFIIHTQVLLLTINGKRCAVIAMYLIIINMYSFY